MKLLKISIIVIFFSFFFFYSCSMNVEKKVENQQEKVYLPKFEDTFKIMPDKNDTLFKFNDIKKELVKSSNFSQASKFNLIDYLPSSKKAADIFLFEELNSNCESQFLGVADRNLIISVLCIRKICDSDQSVAEYSYFDYEIKNATIKIIRFSEIAQDNKLIDKDGFLINELTRDDILLKKDTAVSTYKLIDIDKLKLKWPNINYPR